MYTLILSSIGLPPTGKFNMDVNPAALVFKNQSVKGTLVAGLGDVDETLDFARRGNHNFPISDLKDCWRTEIRSRTAKT
jgi:D-arabinose 1-dehydrogenase-like Zn-dependent alcohol dehydrogenase